MNPRAPRLRKKQFQCRTAAGSVWPAEVAIAARRASLRRQPDGPARILDRQLWGGVLVLPLHFYKSCFILLSKRKGTERMTERIELPQGTLDLLILRTLSTGPQHGWAISERVQQVSSEVLSIQQGSLYPALHRLERRGWIKAKWGTSDNNRRAKYYELTRTGAKQLERETEAWRKLTVAIAQVLEGA